MLSFLAAIPPERLKKNVELYQTLGGDIIDGLGKHVEAGEINTPEVGFILESLLLSFVHSHYPELLTGDAKAAMDQLVKEPDPVTVN